MRRAAVAWRSGPRSGLGAALLLLAPTSALAADPPDAERAVLPIGSVVDVAASLDGRLVAAVTPGTLTVLDLHDPAGGEVTASICDSPNAVALSVTGGTELRAWIACGGATLQYVPIDATGDLAAVSTAIDIAVGGEDLVALAASSDGGQVYVAEARDGLYDQVHVVVAETEEVDPDSTTPLALTHEIGALVIDPYDGWLMAAGSDGRQTTLTLAGEVVYAGTPTILYSGNALVDGVALDSVTAYLLDGTDGAIYAVSSGGYGTYTTLAIDLGASSAMVAVTGEDGVDRFFVAEDEGTVRPVDRTTGELGATVDLSSAADALAATPAEHGLLFAGTSQGLAVLGAGPWVEVLSVDPEVVGGDQDVTLTFTSDEDGAYQVCFGAALTASEADCSGPEGSVSAGETASVTVPLTALDEGTQVLTVFVADDLGNEGHDAISIEVDTPPDPVTDLDAGFGDSKLVVTFARGEESDIVGYRLYFRDGEVSEADGAPDFQYREGGAGVSSPLWVPQPATGTTVQATIAPLQDHVLHCVAASAVDASGQEGPWSAGDCDTPAPTGGWSAHSGEASGGCSAAGPGGAGRGPAWLVLCAAVTALRRAARVRPGR
ncbi:hypothetical protein L6R50_01390 [Myxococcota bacterium]|nr:hypothetical protein [Myxococcota bacterium]